MDLHKKTFSTEVDGASLTLEVSDLAGQANAAVLGTWGDTVVLVTAVMGDREVSMGYFPLMVDYEERFYAVGKIMGSRFMRREGRPSEEAVLSARIIDRTIRPLFDQRMRREVQVVVTVLSHDGEHDPTLVALIAGSAALGISDIPWGGPVAAYRFKECGDDDALTALGLFAGTKSRISMVEFEGTETGEDRLADDFEKAQKEITRLVEFQEGIIKEIGKEKQDVPIAEADPALRKLVTDFVKGRLDDVAGDKAAMHSLKDSLLDHVSRSMEGEGAIGLAEDVLEELVDGHVHELALEKETRVDGRALDVVRPLHTETKLFERTHGSGLFMRGMTQVLSVLTLAPPSAQQLIETLEMEGKRRFMLHYNFPSFSVGETKPMRGPGRREIGHGALAAKAIRNLIPPQDGFPYTIRIVSETLSSNGSSSMASVCSASLALMDGGVPMKRHIAGIAMGLMMNSKGDYKVLTDIQGPEDHYGDMDLKIAGTEEGVTAVQMDVKIVGITKEIFVDALKDAKAARLHILKEMGGAIDAPRGELSPYAPIILTLHIDPERIGELIGPGGKTINGIIKAMDEKVTIDIDDDGSVFIGSEDQELGKKAYEMVQDIMREYAVGDVLEGEVVRVMDFGAIVQFGPNKDGMVHVSELKDGGYVDKVEDVVKLGDKVRVKVKKVEEGKIGLTMKGVDQG